MSNSVYANAVLEAQATNLLETKINARSLMTIDNSLAESAGMKKTINVYTYSGEAEALNVGAGSTANKRGSISYSGTDYNVLRLQQAFDYFDEDAMKDPFIVDAMMNSATQVMVNKLNADFFNAIATTSTKLEVEDAAAIPALSYDIVVDAIAELNIEDESGLFLLINPAEKAELRKDNDYVSAHSGDVVYNGQVGTICGIPVIVSKKVPAHTAFVATREAVKCFMKKDVVVETDRDVDTNENSVYLKTYYVVALVDATKACKITMAKAE